MQTPGFSKPGFAAHSLSLEQGEQVFFVQMGVTSLVHSEFVVHSTHAPAGPQAGVLGDVVAQAWASARAHPTQTFARQNGRFGSEVHCPSPVHSTQTLLEQTGFEVGQSSFRPHVPTTSGDPESGVWSGVRPS